MAQSYIGGRRSTGVWTLKEAQRLKDLEKENGELKKMLADQMLKARALEIALGKKHLSPERQRGLAEKVQAALRCSGRKACRWLGFHRSTMRYRPRPVSDRQRLLEQAIVRMSEEHPTMGYKKITRFAPRQRVSHKRKAGAAGAA